MKKIVFILILCSVFCLDVLSQIKINKLDVKGQKEGLWITPSIYGVSECYYKNGVLSGTYMEFNKERNMLTLGEYNDGQICGNWYHFGKQGHLMISFKNIQKNTGHFLTDKDGKEYIPDYQCYYIGYYSNGTIKEEGIILWYEGDDPVSDCSSEYGLWKYYDEDGNLTNTVNHQQYP